MDKCCGTCRWWENDACDWPWPPHLRTMLPDYLQYAAPEMDENEGETCPTYEPKEQP